MHAPLTQLKPGAQSVDTVQNVLQPASVQAYGAHEIDGPEVQTPVPLQLPAAVNVVPEHDAVPQGVMEPYSSQLPAPSQNPSVPQVDGGAAAHSLSGSIPARMGPQSPSAPLPFFAAEHARQRPVQALEQHTPSTQEPLPQSAPVMQGLPFGSGTVVELEVLVTVTVVVVAGVSAMMDVTQLSTASSIVCSSPITTHPPTVSAFAIAALNFCSAADRQVGSTCVPRAIAFW